MKIQASPKIIIIYINMKLNFGTNRFVNAVQKHPESKQQYSIPHGSSGSPFYSLCNTSGASKIFHLVTVVSKVLATVNDENRKYFYLEWTWTGMKCCILLIICSEEL